MGPWEELMGDSKPAWAAPSVVGMGSPALCHINTQPFGWEDPPPQLPPHSHHSCRATCPLLWSLLPTVFHALGIYQQVLMVFYPLCKSIFSWRGNPELDHLISPWYLQVKRMKVAKWMKCMVKREGWGSAVLGVESWPGSCPCSPAWAGPPLLLNTWVQKKTRGPQFC